MQFCLAFLFKIDCLETRVGIIPRSYLPHVTITELEYMFDFKFRLLEVLLITPLSSVVQTQVIRINGKKEKDI